MSTPELFRTDCERFIANQGRLPDAERFQMFVRRSWEHKMVDNPEWATEIGYPGQNGRWMEFTPEAVVRRKDDVALQLEVLISIDRNKLMESDRLSYDLLLRSFREDQEQNQFPHELLPINQMDGIQQYIPRLLAMMPNRTVPEVEDIISRLEKVPDLVDQVIGLMREGVKAGITPPRICMADVSNQIASQIKATPAESAMLAAVEGAKSHIDAAAYGPLRSAAQGAYRGKVVPAFEKLHRYLVESYLPACREEIAWSALPNGKSWYESTVRRHTTTDMTPGQVFETGMSEVARIRKGMEEVIAQTGFKGNFAEFCEFLRTDPRFYCATGEELLRTYRDISKRIDPELTRLFGRLPRLPYGVIPIPEYAEKSQTTAYYQPGSPEAGRPGYFYANTYDLKSRPKWEMEALTLHEAVPGHHLQIALAQEMENLPEFRKHSWITAYGEGWALYAESLGEQMGFFRDPYSRFGQLTYEMWRAVRLVVDPGMHAKGWSRQQAIDFFRQNSSKPLHDIEVEIDRYIVWPGQALAYKIGELTIRKIRGAAELILGEKFNLRAFHDELLCHGCLPLGLLEARMRQWVERQSKAAG
jgi:uncharacterized protein (DUF885 family)